MPSFSQESLKHIREAHPDLQEIVAEAIKIMDFKVIDGARTVEEQRKNVEKGVSKTMNSKHLPQAGGWSHALDLMPYPIKWAEVERGLNAVKKVDSNMEIARCYILIGLLAGIAHMKGIKIRQGADWDGDENLGEHSFIDLPHIELVNPRPAEPRRT